MRTAYQYAITLPAMFLAPLALAHEGHGYTSAGSLFHLAEPIHLLPIVVILIAAFGVRRLLRPNSGR
jgi:hypothetical protein